ncbi:Gfo/Idh/MocA family oxidoreductase [Paenibacillus sp. GYB004]|uniref:Gfo/Idh/MocA family protein n=1 Tax=Paenibacillus sp. GYB004 TaxID=2994393 RepID=UPI002F961411
MTTTYSIAVIGAGQIAHTHLRALQSSERARPVAIADVLEERAQQLGSEYGLLPYTDYKQMVLEQKPDLVIITLPHFLHKEAAVWCAEQGCHMLLEKPMALNVAECMEINDAAERNRVVVAVGHMQQFFAEHIAAKSIIASGQLGELVMVNDKRWGNYFQASRPAWFLEKAKSGGGVVINLGSHSIDRIQWLTDSRIAAVRASMTYRSSTDVEGSAALFMETTSGVPVTVSLSGYKGVPANETELLFTDGALRIGIRRGLSIGTDGTYTPVTVPPSADAFVAQLESVLDTVEYGKPLSTSGAYGQSVVAVVEAAYRSHETGTEQQVSQIQELLRANRK